MTPAERMAVEQAVDLMIAFDRREVNEIRGVTYDGPTAEQCLASVATDPLHEIRAAGWARRAGGRAVPAGVSSSCTVRESQ